MLGKVLVTGGAGCLGSHIVELLHEKRAELGVSAIVVLDVLDRVRWASEEDDRRIRASCDTWVVGSITDPAVVAEAVAGCDVVIHTASLVDTGSARPEPLFEVNVRGTETLIAACQAEDSRVKALVYASSVDVVVNIYGFEDTDGLNEETSVYALDDPKIDQRLALKDVYGVTKTLAEKKVLKANTRNVLRTCAVRPLGLYGERDSVHLGSVLTMACRLGPLMICRFGDGSAVFQHVYVRNCAWMHILAAVRLVEGNNKVAGQVFFGIDDTKVNNFFDFFEPYLAAKGYKIPWINIPESIGYPLAAFVEDVYVTLRTIAPRLFGSMNLFLSRRAIQGTCFSAWFETDKAKRLLGYEPLVSPKEARRRSIAYFATLNDIFPPGRYKYKPGEYDYEDDGRDYRPSDSKYLARGVRRGHPAKSLLTILPVLSLGGVAAGLFIGVRKGYIQIELVSIPNALKWVVVQS